MSAVSPRLVALSLALTALLAGCSSPPPIQRLPEMSFAQQAPILLDVARVEVVAEYRAPAERPHIEYDMPVSPENAFRRWVQDRLKPVGKQGVVRVVIKNASATEVPLPTDQSVTGLFKKEQGAKADLVLEVAVQMLDNQQFTVADATGRATRSSTEPDGQKLNERDRLLYDLTYDLVKGLNEQLDPDIRVALNKWVVTR